MHTERAQEQGSSIFYYFFLFSSILNLHVCITLHGWRWVTDRIGDTQGMLRYITSQPIGNDCFTLFIYVYILVRAGIGIFEAEGWLFIAGIGRHDCSCTYIPI